MTQVSFFLFLKMAFLSLKRHKVRSSLALIGIIIGIGAMMVTMAIGEGTRLRIQSEILAMGDKWIYVTPGNFLLSKEVKRSKAHAKTLSINDYFALSQLKQFLLASTPVLDTKEEIKYGSLQVVASLQGVKEDYFKIEPRGLAKGNAFTKLHEEGACPVCVIGSTVALRLFPKEDPLGKWVNMGKYYFQVVGVFNEAPKRLNSLNDPNVNVVVPFSALRKKLLKKEEQSLVHSIILRPKNEIDSNQLVSNTRRLLRFEHQLKANDGDDFTIWDLATMLKAAQSSGETFNRFLLISSAISLLVGGIGIMNIMLVTVVERKREIGIKMAIGATAFDILFQFLLEAILLCLSGGIFGILLGSIGAYLLSLCTDFQVHLTVEPMLLALVTTMGVGLFFGFYPAYKGSRLEPVVALQ